VPFFQVALPFFGWTAEIPKDDVAKGRELAKCLQTQSFILILDGLEPLQHPTHFLDGELKDTALQACFEEVRWYGLASSPSLILISSRQPLVELQEWETKRFVTIDLQTLPVSDGAKVLAHLGESQRVLATGEGVDGGDRVSVAGGGGAGVGGTDLTTFRKLSNLSFETISLCHNVGVEALAAMPLS